MPPLLLRCWHQFLLRRILTYVDVLTYADVCGRKRCWHQFLQSTWIENCRRLRTHEVYFIVWVFFCKKNIKKNWYPQQPWPDIHSRTKGFSQMCTWSVSSVPTPRVTYADVCWRMHADVCWRMHVYRQCLHHASRILCILVHESLSY